MNAPTAQASLNLRLRVDDDWPFILDLWVASWRATYPEIDFEARRDWLLTPHSRVGSDWIGDALPV